MMQSLFFYGFNSLAYYIISVIIVLFTRYCVKKANGKVNLKIVGLLTIGLFVISTIFAAPLTLLIDDGIPSDHWGNYLYQRLETSGVENTLATLVAVSFIKFLDVIMTMIIVMTAYKLTPQNIKDETSVIQKYIPNKIDQFGDKSV